MSVGSAQTRRGEKVSKGLIERVTRSIRFRVGRRWTQRQHMPFRAATAPVRVRPRCFIIGTQKGGTSSLHTYLARHAQVAPPRLKELGYFSDHYDRSERWYRSNFPLRPCSGASVGIESTPEYLFYPTVPERLYDFEPEARLIVILRDPVERAFSHYRHMVRIGVEPLGFEEAIAAESRRLAPGLDLLSEGRDPDRAYRRYSYVARGHYARQLDRWCTVFPRQQLLLLRSEEMFGAPASTVSRCLEFMGADDTSLPDDFEISNRGRPGQMSERAREDLARLFSAPNRDLATRYAITVGIAG